MGISWVRRLTHRASLHQNSLDHNSRGKEGPRGGETSGRQSCFSELHASEWPQKSTPAQLIFLWRVFGESWRYSVSSSFNSFRVTRSGGRCNSHLSREHMSFPFKYKDERGLDISRKYPFVPINGQVLGFGEVHLWGWLFSGRKDTCAMVQRIAGVYSGSTPRKVRLRYLPGGKPHFGRKGPHFSLSHTDGRVLAAFSRFSIGLDIEKESRSVSANKIARRCFHSSECLALASCPQENLQKIFLRMWVQKEAAVKLAGEGIALGLKKIKIKTNTPSWRVYRQDRRLHIKEINPWPGIVGALASECQFIVTVFREN